MRKRQTPLSEPPDRHPFIRLPVEMEGSEISLVFRRWPSKEQLEAVSWFDTHASRYSTQGETITRVDLLEATEAAHRLILSMWADPVYEEPTFEDLWAMWPEVAIWTIGCCLWKIWSLPSAGWTAQLQTLANFMPAPGGNGSVSESASPGSVDTHPAGGTH